MSLRNTQIQAKVLLICLSIVMLAPSIRTDLSGLGYNSSNYHAKKQELVQLFEQWMQKHEKTYAQPEDKVRGFENFAKNFEFVYKWNVNKEKGGHVVGLNNLADLSIEEFREKYLTKIAMRKREEVKNDQINMKKEHEYCSASPFLDWRKQGVVTRVKDQGYDCGKFTVLLFKISI